ncbi:MAG: WG repeat-containing protein [Polyangiaceae bacterium]|nr:WG repeat-containing protein [Polyangiaceae bacterium]
MTAPGRFSRAWLRLARRGDYSGEGTADLAAFSRAVAEHGPHRLVLGAVTFTTPDPELPVASSGRVSIATRDDGTRFELEPESGGVWCVRPNGEAARDYADLDDLLRTYYQPSKDSAGLGAALREIDRYDQYFAEGAFERACVEAREAQANGQVGFLPTHDIPPDPVSLTSPSKALRLSTHPVRTRVVSLDSGAETVVLEGWWQLESAWVADDRVCVLCSEGKVELDRHDPEVATLDSLNGAFPGSERWAKVQSKGLLHVVSATGDYLYQIEVLAEHVQSAMDGRVVVLTRAARKDRWGTVVLGATDAGVMVLAKHPADIGPLRVGSDRIVGSHGFELLGVSEALRAAGAWRVQKIHDRLALETPPAPPASELRFDGSSALWLNLRSDARRPSVRDLEALGIDVTAVGEVKRHALSPDRARCAVATLDAVWDVDVGTGAIEPVYRCWPQVLSVQRGQDECWLLLRVFQAHSEVQRFCLRDGVWARDLSLPVTGFDQLHLGGGGRLLALTLQNSPPELAFTVFVGVDGEGALHHLGRLNRVVSAVWDEGDRTYAELLGGTAYELSGVDAALEQSRTRETRPLRAIVFDVAGHYGKREFLPRYDHDFGFIDREGHRVIDFQFTSVFDFEGGASRVAHLGPRLFGLVGPSGELHEPHYYSWIGPLSGGCRRVARGEPDILGRFPAVALWGLLRRDGQCVWLPAARALTDMVEGFARVEWSAGGYDLVDRDGGLLFGEPVSGCGTFREGRCAASVGELWGYVDDRGSWVVEPRFQQASAFSEGVAAVRLAGGGFRFIDRDGDSRGDAEFDEAGLHCGGLARVRRGDRWGYVNDQGALVIEARFEQARDFVEGLAAVRLGEAWTWITPTGRALGEPRYERVFDASAGIGIFEHRGTRGFVSPSGETLAEGLESAHEFREGLAAIQRRARWGFLDTAGQLVIPPRFAGVMGFSEGLAAARSGGAWGFIDATGEFVIPPQLSSCGSFHGGRAWVRRPYP